MLSGIAWRFRVAAILFLVCFLVYLLTGDYQHQNVDSISTLLAAWRLAEDGTFALDEFQDRGYWLVPAHGHWVSGRFPGSILLATPFYWLARADAPFPSAAPSVVAAATCTAAAVAVLYLLLLRLGDRRRALLAALVFAFGTSTWPVSGNALWTHGPAQLALVVALLSAAQRRFYTCGAACGAAVLVRPHLGILALMLCVFLALDGARRSAAKVAVGTALGCAALVLYNGLVLASWSVSGGYARLDAALDRPAGALAFLGNVAAALLSPGRGLLVFTPVLLLLALGLPTAWRRGPWWSRAAATAGAAYLAVQLLLSSYSGGYGCYGGRMTLETLTLLTPALTVAATSWVGPGTPSRRRASFAVLATAGVVVNGTGAVLYTGRPIDPGEPGKWALILLARNVGTAEVLTVAAVLAALCAAAAVLVARTCGGAGPDHRRAPA